MQAVQIKKECMEVSSGNIIKIQNHSFFQEVLMRMKEGREVKITVAGESMRPFLRSGDQVLLQPVRREELMVGQIVLANYSNAYVLHRLVGKKKGLWMLAGDANYSQIEYVTSSDIKAVITQAYRKDSKLSIYSWQSRLTGLIWFRMRLYRRLCNKLIRN